MAGALSQADVAAIESYFCDGHHFERSTFGALLQRQATIAFNADGKRHKLTRRTWWWRPQDYERGMFGSLVESIDAPMPPMHVTKDGGEPSYTPEDRVLEAFGSASRRMLLVERVRRPGDKDRAESTGRRAKCVLEAFYGDRGRRWEWYASDRKDEHNKAIKGCGPGAIAAVFVLTTKGREFIERERSKGAKRAGKGAPHLTDDEVLSATYNVLKAQPDAGKTALLNRVRDEAEALVLEAQRVWKSTAPQGDDTDRPQRGDWRGRARVYHHTHQGQAATVEAGEVAA